MGSHVQAVSGEPFLKKGLSMTQKDTIEKAYGNVPRELPDPFDFDILEDFYRSLRYRWIQFCRFFTR